MTHAGILIRTALFRAVRGGDGSLTLTVAAGLLAPSDPAAFAGLGNAAGRASETMLWLAHDTLGRSTG